MSTLETTCLFTVKKNFDNWIDPLSFNQNLRIHIDFDFYCLHNEVIRDEKHRQFQQDIYWKNTSMYLKSISEHYRSRKQYLTELPKLITEIRHNALNVPKGDLRRPSYKQELQSLCSWMTDQVSKFSELWNNDKNELGWTHFQKSTHFISSSDYSIQIINYLDEICIYITSVIHDLTELLKQLREVIAEEFSEVAITHKSETALMGKTTKRVNTEAKEKHKRLLGMYDSYIVKGSTPAAAIKSLVHDFRFEYCITNPSNRKKVIQKIIRESGILNNNKRNI